MSLFGKAIVRSKTNEPRKEDIVPITTLEQNLNKIYAVDTFNDLQYLDYNNVCTGTFVYVKDIKKTYVFNSGIWLQIGY